MKYKIAIVKWEDIITSDSNWRSEDEAVHYTDTESGIVNQCGYILDQDENYLVLIDSFFEDGDTVGTVTRIPMQNVRDIKIINGKEEIRPAGQGLTL